MPGVNYITNIRSTDYSKAARELFSWFENRGYPKDLLKEISSKIKTDSNN